MTNPRSQAEQLLEHMLANGQTLSETERECLLERACTDLPAEVLAGDGQPGSSAGLLMVLETRVKNLLDMVRLTSQDYALLREKLLYRAYATVRDMEKAEDLVQDTFVTLVTRRQDFRGDSSFATWIHSILFFRIRSVPKSRTVSLEQPILPRKAGETGRTLAELLPDDAPSIAFMEETQGAREQLLRILAMLPEQLTDRHELQAMNLIAIQGATYDEAAQIMGLSKNYLYRIISVARKKLLSDSTIQAMLEDRHGSKL